MYRWNKKVYEYPMEQSGQHSESFIVSNKTDVFVPSHTREGSNGTYTLYTDTQQE